MVDYDAEVEEDEASMPCRRKNKYLEDSDDDNNDNKLKGRKITKNNSRVQKVKDYEVLEDKNLDLIAEAKG